MNEDTQLVERIMRDVLYGHDIAPPVVDPDKCKGCGHCAKVCPALVFELQDKKSHVVHGVRCNACGQCWAVCPEEAVTQNEVVMTNGLKPGPEPAVGPDALQLLIRERRSTRIFRDTPVSKEQLQRIIEAGRYIPTASNRQDVGYIVLSDDEKVAELRLLVENYLDRMSKALENRAMRPVFRLRMGRLMTDVLRFYAMGYGVWADITAEEKKKRAYFPLPFGPAAIITHAQSFDALAQVNCSMALYACSLMAHSLGLGSCWLGFVPIAANTDKRVKSWLNLPDENECYGAIVIGHPGVRYRRLVERKAPEIDWR
jgi:nitroreductase/NAD-dependent dihydropyrimidine dehydrogenase PreA subunit